MPSVLECLPPGSRVAVIRLRSLGDCVLTTPALALLKRYRPDLSIAVVVEERFRAVFEGSPDVDELLPPSLAALRGRRPALCLNLHGGTRSARMTALSGARFRAGFAHFSFQLAYNVRIPRAQEILGEERKVHTAEHLASAVYYLGAPLAEVPPARLFGVGNKLGPVANRPQIDGLHYSVIHPAAATPEKTWPADRFVEVAHHLRRQGVDTVFIGGPADDLAPFRDFRTLAGAPLAEVKSLMAGASLFVGNDSGPAHVAAAFGVPVVVLFGPSDPAVWAPWRTPAEVLTGSGGDIATIAVAEVLAALDRVRTAPRVHA